MKTQIIIFIFTFLSVLGCKKIDELTHFDMEYNETVVVPATLGINMPFNILTPDIETNSESTFEVNDTRKDLIEEIKLTTLTLTLTSPSNADFNFLESINIYISAEGLDEIMIAWQENIPSDITVLDMEVEGVDIKDYIKKDSFSLRLNTETDELLGADHHIDIHSVFFVDAKILGI